MARTFEVKPGIRSRVPVWVGLCGPSGGGKTLSALRLADGFTRVVGGKVGVVDTEADRSLHYAPKTGEKATPPKTFTFEHLSFGAPFSSSDYADAIRQLVARGCTTVVVDSLSHEHESIGGVLEQFEEEVERMSKGDPARAERIKMLAWKKPKMARQRMIQELLQMKVNLIGCFRAKQKLKPVKGSEPVHLGYMPITGDEMIYEFPSRFLVRPGSDGVPSLRSDEPGESEWIRIPEQFRYLFAKPAQLTEDIGEAMARWAEGAEKPVATIDPTEILVKLEKLNVSEARALALVGRATAAELTADDIAILATKGRNIVNKRQTVDEAFPPMAETPTT